jgi:hypothetical protein
MADLLQAAWNLAVEKSRAEAASRVELVFLAATGLCGFDGPAFNRDYKASMAQQIAGVRAIMTDSAHAKLRKHMEAAIQQSFAHRRQDLLTKGVADRPLPSSYLSRSMIEMAACSPKD